MQRKNRLLLCIILILLIPFITADLGTLKIKSSPKQWNTVYSNDKDFFVYVEDKNKQKTQICLLSKTATSPSQLDPNKRVYDRNGNLIIQLNRMIMRLDRDYYGYCRLIDNEEYLKFGEHSTVLVFQNESRIEYNHEDYNVNVTLYKNKTGIFDIHINDIFVFLNQDLYKFGANDTNSSGIEHYRYHIKADRPLYVDNDEIYILAFKPYYTLKHTCNFSDICKHDYSNCSINKINDYEYEIIFYSESIIDPYIQVKTTFSNVVSITSLNDKEIVAYQTGGNIYFKVYYLNGTIYTNEQTIATGLSANARIKIKAVDSNSFLYSYLNTTNLYDYYGVYYINGSRKFQLQNTLFANPDIDMAFMSDSNFYYYAYREDIGNDFILKKIYKSNLSIISLTIDNSINAEETLYNEVDCDLVNSTRIACFIVDDDEDDTTLFIINPVTMTLLSTTDIDLNAGNEVQVAMSQANNYYLGLTYFDSGDKDIYFTVRDLNGNVLYPLTSLDTDAGAITRLDIESLIYNNQSYFLVSWNDRLEGFIRGRVYNITGGLLYSYDLASDESATYLLYDTDTRSPFLNLGLPQSVYAFSYVNASSLTLLNFFYINGTEYVPPIIVTDILPPNATIIQPLNNTQFNYYNISFICNFEDNMNLSNSTFYIKNITDDIIYSNLEILNGLLDSRTDYFNFANNGTYKFYYDVYDKFSNSYTTETRYLTINVSFNYSLVSMSLQVSQYPYVDVNVTFPLKVFLTLNGDKIQADSVFINFTNSSFNFTYNSSDGSYDLNLLFTDINDFPFIIQGKDSYYKNIANITGEFLVREPYYVSFKLFEVKDTDVDPYENDFGFIIAELKNPNKYYDPLLENYITPLLFNSTYNRYVYHTPYDDGEAILKLYERNKTYVVRFLDGDIDFDGLYSIPEVKDSYGINFYVGEYYLTGNESYNVYLEEKDIRQYRWLANTLFVISIVLIIAISIFLFFVIPTVPQLSFMFGVGFCSLAVLLRIVVWFWLKW